MSRSPTPMSYQPPGEARELAGEIAALAATRAVRVWAVGGSVRDGLLGRNARDLDIAVEGDALAFGEALASGPQRHFVPLDDENGVARVVFDEGPVRHVDVAALQGTLEDDLRRRDFTVDALAAPLAGGYVTDVTGGTGDLAARVIRMTSAQAFDDDPLRLMRAVRLAWELGFSIEPDTLSAVRVRAGRLREVAGERRRDELARMLSLPSAYGAIGLLDDCGLLDVLLPEVTFGRGVSQPGGFHVYDVFGHNLRAVEAMDLMLADTAPEGDRGWLCEDLWDVFGWCRVEMRTYLAEELSQGRTRASLLKLAALLHDVAKPQTRTIDEAGSAHFFGHGPEGAIVAGRIMRRLRFSSSEVRFVQRLVSEHLRPVQLAQVGEAPTRRALYRFYRDLGDAVPGVLLLSLADAAASRGPLLESQGWSQHVRYMNSLLVRSIEDEGILDPPRLLTGDDIMSRFRLRPGPAIGRVLDALREAQGAGDVKDREEAWAFAGDFLAGKGRIEL